MRGADGVKIAVLRSNRADLPLIWAAAHTKRYAAERNCLAGQLVTARCIA
jgi:hypothetical protein